MNNITPYKAFIMQFIGSGFYVWTYYSVIVDVRAPSNIFGFALGAVVSISNLSFGPMTGGCVNIIKYLGPRVVGANFENWSSYFIAPLLGGIFSGFYFDFFVLKTKQKKELIDDDEPQAVAGPKKQFNIDEFKKSGLQETEGLSSRGSSRRQLDSLMVSTRSNNVDSKMPERGPEDVGKNREDDNIEYTRPKDLRDKEEKLKQNEEDKRTAKEKREKVAQQTRDTEENLFSF